MANQIWRGDAVAIKQVTTIAVTGTWATADTATLTINGKDLTVTIGSDTTIADVVAAIVAAVNASSATDSLVNDESRNVGGQEIAEFTEVVASGSASPITLTAVTAGVPFTVTASESTAGTGALGAPAEATAATGPNFWSNADNWSSGSVPVNSDDVYFEDNEVDVLYGLDQNAVTLTSLNIAASYTGKIGLPTRNSTGYYEYRDTYLKISATTINVGEGEGAGSGRLKVNVGSAACTLNVYSTGSGEDDQLAPLIWKGTNAANVVNINKGELDVAIFAGETATIATVNCGYRINPAGDVSMRCGSGVTLTTINQSGGLLEVRSNITTVNITDGELLVLGTATMTTLNADGGAVRYRSNGTLTTAKVGSGATLDFRQDMRARTVTNLELYEQASYYDPFGTVTLTNGADFIRCTPADLAVFDVVPHRTWTPSAV